MIKMCCPRCGQKRLQANVQNNSSVYSAKKGCLGWLLFGPLGLLCGLSGSKKNETTMNWICTACGNQFENPDDMRKSVAEGKKSVIACIVTGVVFMVFVWIFFASLELLKVGFIIGIIFGGAFGLSALILYTDTKKEEAELTELEKNMRKFDNV